jgi:hypothetical protein
MRTRPTDRQPRAACHLITFTRHFIQRQSFLFINKSKVWWFRELNPRRELNSRPRRNQKRAHEIDYLFRADRIRNMARIQSCDASNTRDLGVGYDDPLAKSA